MSPPAVMTSPAHSSIVAQGVSPPASTAAVKLRPDGEVTSPDEDGVGGDGGGLQRTSGDEAGSDDDDDPVGEMANQSGKRKRPISVSYVFSIFPLLLLNLLSPESPPAARAYYTSFCQNAPLPSFLGSF